VVKLSPGGVHEAAQQLGPRLDAMAELFAGLAECELEQLSAMVVKLTQAIRVPARVLLPPRTNVERD
jgi:hypothetical protein